MEFRHSLYASMSPPNMAVALRHGMGIGSPQVTQTNHKDSERYPNERESGKSTNEIRRAWTKSVVAQCPASIRHPTLWSRKPKDTTNEIGYLSLPGELRNKIMSLVLLPGNIYLSASRNALLDPYVLPPPVDLFGDFFPEMAFLWRFLPRIMQRQ